MALKSFPTFVNAPKTGLVQIVNADASGQKTVLAAGADGSKVTSLRACSDDTAARVLQISKLRSGTNYVIGSVNVPAASGTDGTAVAVDLMNSTMLPGLPKDNDGQPYIFLESGDSLQVKSLTTVTAAKTVHVVADYANF